MAVLPADEGVPRFPFWSRVIPALLLCAAAGCGADGCSGGKSKPTSPKVASVEIVPRTIYVREASGFQLEARARNAAGTILPGKSAQWSVPAEYEDLVAFEPASGNPTAVTVVPFAELPGGADPGAVRFTIPGVEAEIDGRRGTAVIVVGRTVETIGTDVATDRVELKDPTSAPDAGPFGSPAAAPPAVVVIGARFESICPRDTLFAVSGVAHFEGNVQDVKDCPDPPPPPPKQRAALFAADAAAQREDANIWSIELGNVLSKEMNPPIQVGVVLWNGMTESGALDAQDLSNAILDEADLTNHYLRRSLAGTQLQWPTPVLQAAESTFDPGSCSDDNAVQALLGTQMDPAAKLIHIAFVDELATTGPLDLDGYAKGGITCPIVTGRPYGLILVRGLSDFSLAHEIGHILGLNKDVLPNGATGHVSGAGYHCGNPMWIGPGKGLCAPLGFNLGQVYRMNWQSGKAWLHHAGLRSDTETVNCAPPTAPCPPLSLDHAPPPSTP